MKKLLALLLVAAALLTGAAFWWNSSHSSSPITPRTEPIDRGPIVQRLASGQGKIVPKRVVPIVTDVPAGKIVDINPKAEPGQYVPAGEWLLRLDSTQAELTVKKTEAELAAAQWEQEQARLRLNEVQTKKDEADAAVRYAEKYLEGVRSNGNTDLEKKAQAQLELARQAQKAAEIGLQAAQAALQAAEKKVEAYRVGLQAARKQLEMCTIKAPEAGYVLEKRVVVGQLITPQAVPVLFVLTPSLDDLELSVLVSETDILKVSEGMEVEFTVDAFSGENLVFRGRVQRVGITPAQPSGLSGFRLPVGLTEMGNIWSLLSGSSGNPVNYAVTVGDFQAPPPKNGQVRSFKPGMTANVDFIHRVVAEPVLRIPNDALVFRPPTLKEQEAQQIRAQETSSRKPVWVWTPNGGGGRMEMIWVTIRPEATDGRYTQLVDAGGLKEGDLVVVEVPPPAPKRGLFETPVRIGPN